MAQQREGRTDVGFGLGGRRLVARHRNRHRSEDVARGSGGSGAHHTHAAEHVHAVVGRGRSRTHHTHTAEHVHAVVGRSRGRTHHVHAAKHVHAIVGRSRRHAAEHVHAIVGRGRGHAAKHISLRGHATHAEEVLLGHGHLGAQLRNGLGLGIETGREAYALLDGLLDRLLLLTSILHNPFLSSYEYTISFRTSSMNSNSSSSSSPRVSRKRLAAGAPSSQSKTHSKTYPCCPPQD